MITSLSEYVFRLIKSDVSSIFIILSEVTSAFSPAVVQIVSS